MKKKKKLNKRSTCREKPTGLNLQLNDSLAGPGLSDSPLNCVSLTDFDFLNLYCQFYHKREEIPVCYFSPIMVSFRFHYNNLGFDLRHFLNGFFVFFESPQSAVRAESELRVWGSRGFPGGPTSLMDKPGLGRGMETEEAARVSLKIVVAPFVIPIKGHYRGLLKFSSMRGREERNQSNVSPEKSSPSKD